MAEPPWLLPRPGGVEIRVHARPGSRRPGIAGLHGNALCVRVAARPERGAANRELLRLMAGALAVAPSAVELAAGGGSREKRVHVRGITLADARARLEPQLR